MIVTLTNHGQLSIPELIQRRLGLSEGTELDIKVVNNRIVLEPKCKRRFDTIGIARPTTFSSIGFETGHDRSNDSIYPTNK